jgi:hypothetical protein
MLNLLKITFELDILKDYINIRLVGTTSRNWFDSFKIFLI